MTSTQPNIDQLSQIARARDLRVAVVESLTAGGFAHAVGAGEGASEWFAGGIVAYMTDIKQQLLGMKPGVDPCSAEAAEQLAVGGLELFAADVCISTTGVGGPDSDGEHTAGTVYLGWAVDQVRGHQHLQLQGEPDEVLADAIDAAVHLLVARAQDVHHDVHHSQHRQEEENHAT